ncbi:MAG TPA: DPP IV N-terminal domain-containing protein [Candidatus Acidoferrales bacterium]|nr:DPP IV N-terminal domain-containing protein [Candidatus Acidoferrales bacterium]
MRIRSALAKKLLLVFSINLLALAGRAQTTAPQAAAPKQLTIEQIFAEGGITGRAPETIQWSPDGSKISFVQRDDTGEHGELFYVDAVTGEKKLLVSEIKLSQLSPPINKIRDEREKERLTRYHVAAYTWSPNSKYLLFDSQGQLWYYSLDTGTAVQLTSSPDPSQDPKFSPDGKRLAYVRKHNLYLHPVSGEEGERPLIRDEKDGDKKKDKGKAIAKEKEENILNGEVDWVYAEELDVRSNFFWSPEGKEIIFLQMDETRVPTYPITDWLPTHPRVEREKYPKAGDPNPIVRLGVVGSNGGKALWIKLTGDEDTYVPRFGWIREGWAWAEVLNRKQDVMDLYFINAQSGVSRKVLTEYAPGAWVNVNDDFRILKSGDRFLWTSWRDGHTHIYLYSFNAPDPLASEAKLERQLESGDYEVIAVRGVDDVSGTVFFTANKGDPRQEKLFSVKLDGSAMQAISSGEGNYEAIFVDDGKHFVETHSATLTPPRISVCAPAGPCHKIWEGRSVADYGPIAPQPLEFKADDGTLLYGELILPRPADANQKTPIPLIVNIYGGPAEQIVQDAWRGPTALFLQMLANEGFALFSVDNRGTPNRGKKFSAATRLQFGGIELKDQLTALDQLYAQFPQLDRTRTAIWGWSNGGSMTLYALTHSDRFKAGISVAPVTNWRDYDSIYTERYLGLPKDNARAYDDSIVSAAGNLRGSLLLVHGTSDDNVHFQNTIQMIDALVRAGKQFRLMVYPNKTHGIAGTATRQQLFHMMEDFWNKELK